MTVETKHMFSVDDIEAFEITCARCGTLVSIPLSKCSETMEQFPRCREHRYKGSAAENEAILSLARAIDDIKSELKGRPKFEFRVKFNGCNASASRASGA